VFGTQITKSSNNLTIQRQASSFSRGANLAFIGYLPGQTGDTTLTVVVSRHTAGLQASEQSQRIKRPSSTDNLIGAILNTSGLGSGRYTMSIFSGKTSLAQGDFQITG